MKKLLAWLIAVCLTAASAVSIAAVSVKAEEAAAPAVTPMAWYQFNDASAPGKDSIGHYDLKAVNSGGKDALLVKEEGGEKYLSLTSVRDDKGNGGNAGACLYAPQLDASGKDFSDLIEYSYSVEITFRRNNEAWMGNHYTVAVGRYNNAFQITPWKNSIEVQLLNKAIAQGANDEEQQRYLEENTTLIPYNTTEWTTVLVSANYGSKEAVIYVDGVEKARKTLPEVFFSYRPDPYAFTLGAQCQINGGATGMFATVDIKDCKVFDYALSAKNAQELFEGKSTVYEGRYIQSVEEIDTTGLDVYVTDTNTIEHIMRETLPQKVNVTLSDGIQVKAEVFWMTAGGNKLNGYIKSQFANVSQKYLSVKYGYTVNFEYDESAVRVSNVKLDGVAYTPNTEIDSNIHILTFKAVPLENCEIKSVVWYDMEQESDEDGMYEITFSGGANIKIDAGKETFTITYYDGDTRLGESEYTKGGSEGFKTFTKEGYTFEGWYSDKELTTAVAAPDYAAPQNMTLYAKFVKTGGNSKGGGCAGCGSRSASAALGTLLAVSAGAVILKKFMLH